MTRKTLHLQWFFHQWYRYWFAPSSAANLGFCRVLFFGGIFGLYVGRDFIGWAEISNAFWMPISLFRHFHLTVLPSPALSVVSVIWKVALGLSAIGLFTRSSTVMSFILGLYLLGVPHNFGKTNHADALIILTIGILAVSRCGDGWSIDQMLRNRWSRRPIWQSRSASGEYTWPIRLIWVLMALVFLRRDFRS